MTRNICPVCNGKGKIRNPKKGKFQIPYDNDITCPNCNGEGFVGIPDNFPIKKPFYKTNNKNIRFQSKLKSVKE